MQIVRNIREYNSIQSRLVVLLAEEHPLTAKIQKKGLEEGGFRVFLAKSTNDIIEMVTTQKIDILMMDIHFNKKNGLNLITKLKKTSLNSELKIVLTSIISTKTRVRQTIMDKVDHFIVKPIPQNRMVVELKKLHSIRARKAERIIVNMNASVYIDNKLIPSRVIDISKTGIHLIDKSQRLKKPLGSILKIEIELPKYKNPILFNAIIIRRTAEGYGLKILDISLENKERISKFIEKNGFGNNAETYYL